MRFLTLLVVVLGLVAGCGEPVRTTFRPDAGARADGSLDAPGDGGPACVEHTVYCEGTGFTYQCDDTGAVIGRAACEGDTPTCVPGVGCRVCRPGDRRCNPGDLSATQSCRMDGMGWIDGAACSVDDGESCVSGVCAGRCSESALGRSYLGCDYWPTVTPNPALDPMFTYAVVLSNPQTYEVHATITGGALTEPRAVTLAPGAVETVELPWVVPLVQLDPACRRDLAGRCASSRRARSAMVPAGAYHVHANGPIAAYQFNPLTYSVANRYFSYTNDASLLLPQGVLTQHYTVLAWPDLDDPGAESVGGFASVVATGGESTTVTVRASTRIRAGDGVAAMARGETREFALQAGDVLQLVGDGGGDITGTVIESSLPVAVFAGHDCANVPEDRSACDHLEEQLFPNETWGADYIVSALRDRGPSIPYVVRVFARTDGTRVEFDPDVHPPATLSAGQALEFQSTRHFRVTGSHPFLVAQYMIGQGPAFGGTGAGDPAMVLEVPVQQYRDRYDFYVPSTYPQNFINIVVPTGAALTLDDLPVRGSMELLGGYTVYTLPIVAGAHHLQSASGQGAGIKVYGIAPYTSYMYPGGLDLRLIAPG